MTDPDKIDDRRKTKYELLLDFLSNNFTILAIGAMVAAVLVVVTGVEISVPRRARLIAVVAIGISPAGYVVGNYIISLLYDPAYIYLVDLDAREVDGALYQFPYSDFSELEVIEGQLTELTPRLFTGKDVSLEEMTAKGTWRGSLDDRELLRAITKIEECRGSLEEDAKKGFALETQAFTIVRQATRKAVRSIVKTFEEGALPDQGEGIAAEVDAALERYDLEKEIKEVEDSDVEPDPADVTSDLDEDLEDPEEVISDD